AKGNGALSPHKNSTGRLLSALPQGRNGVHPRSRASRVKTPRNEPTLFDLLPATQAADEAPAQAEILPLAVPSTPRNAGATGPNDPPDSGLETSSSAAPFIIAKGEKGKCRDILAAIRAAKAIDQENRPATEEERQTLSRFAGFGPVA